MTRPTPAMLRAMRAAEVGDDVYSDDPTVNRLQAVLAERAGHAAALWFPSGTQSNLAALMSHCARGDEYLVGQEAHTYRYEGGGAAVLGSIQPQPLANQPDGSIAVGELDAAVKPLDSHFARTRLLALENTIGGRILARNYLAEALAFAHQRGLATHLDGARIFNAAVANGTSLATECEGFDSVSICLSKGLGAPAGSVLCGSREFIAGAHRWRKILGGGMRQVGSLAAAGLHALEFHVERLADDHANAATLGEGLRALGYAVARIATNMVFVDDAEKLSASLLGHGILVSPGARLRLVTHLDLSRRDIARVLEIAAKGIG